MLIHKQNINLGILDITNCFDHVLSSDVCKTQNIYISLIRRKSYF